MEQAIMETNQTFSPLISAIRGAIQVGEDTPEHIDRAIARLYETLLDKNSIEERQVAMILITQTGDLVSRNPAAGLRKVGYASTTPLFCMQELQIDGMLERVIRLLVVTNCPHDMPVVPVYLDGAERLRPDLIL